MSNNTCPLCGKETQGEESFCRNCQEIADTSYPSELLSKQRDESIDTPHIEQNITAEIDQPNLVEHQSDSSEQAGDDKILSSFYKNNKKMLIFFCIALILCVVMGIFGSEYFMKQKEYDQMEVLYWNQCVDKNTPLDYSKYLMRYPEGQFSELASAKIAELREKEKKAWESLARSSNINDFFAFLTDYPDTPYATEVKNRMDSLSWVSATTENTADAYMAYLNNVKLGHFTGHYQSEAQEKYDYLSQLKTVEGKELTDVKEVLKDYFDFLGQKQYTKLEKLMPKVLNNYLGAEQKTQAEVIDLIEGNLKKHKVKTKMFIPLLDSIECIRDKNGIYFITLPANEETVYLDKKKKKEYSQSVFKIELNEQKQLRALW